MKQITWPGGPLQVLQGAAPRRPLHLQGLHSAPQTARSSGAYTPAAAPRPSTSSSGGDLGHGSHGRSSAAPLDPYQGFPAPEPSSGTAPCKLITVVTVMVNVLLELQLLVVTVIVKVLSE